MTTLLGVGGVGSRRQLGNMFTPFDLFSGMLSQVKNPKERKNCMQNGVHCSAVCKSEKSVSFQ